MGDRWYGEGQIIARFSTEVEKPQKCPERGNQLLRCRSTTSTSALQKKVSYGLSVPSSDVLTERLKQIRSAASIQAKSWLLHSAMRLKKVAECSHKSWLGGQTLSWFSRADSASDEVSMEKLHSELSVIANLSTPEMRTSATAKMAAKGINDAEINVPKNAAFPLNKAAEMGCGSNVSNCAGRRVSGTIEAIRERIDVGSTDSTAQTPQCLGSGEKRL